MFGLGGSRKIIGLDIGSSSIKMMLLQEKRGGIHLVGFGMASLPPEAIVGGSIMNTKNITETICELVKELRIQNKEVAIGISGHSVIVKKLALPIMTMSELDDAMPYEAGPHIPYDLDEVYYDYQVIGMNAAGHGGMEVLLIAAKKDMINDYMGVVIEAGLEPVLVDVDVFALENGFEANYGQLPEIVALINIGASLTNINILDHGVSAFTRDCSIGGSAITEALQKEHNVSYDQAESLKCGGQSADDAQAPIVQKVEGVVADVCGDIIVEVGKSLDFFVATTTVKHVSRIFLSGGSSKLTALTQMIETQSGIPVEVMDPLRAIQIAEKKFDLAFLRNIAPQLAVCVGLALRKPGDKPTMHL